jgi:hypothetical protein
MAGFYARRCLLLMAMILLYCTVKYSPVLGVVDEKKESNGGWGEDEVSAQEN